MVRNRAVPEAGEKGHGSGHVRLGSKRIDENRKRDGFGRWVCEEGCNGEVDCRGELVGEAEAWDEEVDLGELFLG